IAAGFGLIHGMGFSNFLRAALGTEESIFVPLLAFNIGLEIGQLSIVAILVVFAGILVRSLGLRRRAWVLTVSAICGVSALVMIVQRAP
ncbi:MAG: HupE/UreJ family protein, partial [Gemmatimonadetes bacterium]|nr:HupE/UreJ family protein [Gemmatimonadota bacterium]